ncbi:MAG: hypothetical protein KAR06_12505, partial [Deltaproteobacteria bacterium]|nr:hypothetical protein [Deltaproteobacteria bacterium]
MTSGIWKSRSGGGCLSVFGLPFLAVGILAAIGEIQPDSGEWYVRHIFTFAFGIPGSILVFGRSGTIVDRTRMQATKWYGLMVPFYRTKYALTPEGEVQITKEVRRSKNSTYTVYPVRIQPDSATSSDSGNKAITIKEPRDYQSSRAIAEELGKLLRYNVLDSSSGESIIRRPE